MNGRRLAQKRKSEDEIIEVDDDSSDVKTEKNEEDIEVDVEAKDELDSEKGKVDIKHGFGPQNPQLRGLQSPWTAMAANLLR